MRMNSFAGGILSDFRLSPIQTDTAVSKTGKVGAAWTLRCGYRQNFTGEGRDWVRSSNGWGTGEKLGTNLTMPSCSWLFGVPPRERKERRERRKETGYGQKRRELEIGEWTDKPMTLSLPEQDPTRLSHFLTSSSQLNSTNTHHASAAMVGQDEL